MIKTVALGWGKARAEALARAQGALIDALIPFATPEEAAGLRQYRAGGISAAALPSALTRACQAIVGRSPRFREPLRPYGAPVATDGDRERLRVLAAAAEVEL